MNKGKGDGGKSSCLKQWFDRMPMVLVKKGGVNHPSKSIFSFSSFFFSYIHPLPPHITMLSSVRPSVNPVYDAQMMCV